MQRIPFLVFYIALIILPTSVQAGIVIEEISYSKANPDEKEKTITYISKNQVKEVESDGNYTLWDLNKGTLYRVNPRKKSFAGGEFIEEFIKEMKEAIRQMKEMGMPSEKMPPPEKTAPPKPAPRLKYTVKNTGQTTRIAGYLATKYQVYRGKDLDEEVWISQDLEKEIKKDLDYKRFERLYRELERALEAAFGPLSTTEVEMDDTTERDRLYEQGWEMKGIDHSIGEVTEVIKVEKKEIPDREFQIPLGYKKVSARIFLEMEEEGEEEN